MGLSADEKILKKMQGVVHRRKRHRGWRKSHALSRRRYPEARSTTSGLSRSMTSSTTISGNRPGQHFPVWTASRSLYRYSARATSRSFKAKGLRRGRRVPEAEPLLPERALRTCRGGRVHARGRRSRVKAQSRIHLLSTKLEAPKQPALGLIWAGADLRSR